MQLGVYMFCVITMLGLMSKSTESSKTKHRDLCLHLRALECICVCLCVCLGTACAQPDRLPQLCRSKYHPNSVKVQMISSDDIFLLDSLSEILTSLCSGWDAFPIGQGVCVNVKITQNMWTTSCVNRCPHALLLLIRYNEHINCAVWSAKVKTLIMKQCVGLKDILYVRDHN